MELNLDWQARRSEVWPEVSYEIRPLRVWAFQALLACWEPSATSPEADPAAIPAPAATAAPTAPPGVRLMEAARRIFPDHVRNLAGLALRREGRSEPATPQALCEETALLPLAGEVIERLIAISELGGGPEKN